MRKTIAWGMVAAAAYLAVAAATFGELVPARPLFDGGAPPEPYRWVDPPKDFTATNQPPESGTGSVPFTEDGLQAGTVATPDRQAALIFAPNGVAEQPGTEQIVVTIRPLDPGDFGDPPPELAYEGNAYEFTATYGEGGTPVQITEDVTVVLRFPFAAEGIFRRDGDEWTELESQPGGFELVADSPTLGTFVTAGPPFHDPGSSINDIIVAGAGLAVVAVGVWIGRLRHKEKARAQRRRAMGKKAKKPPQAR